MNLRPALLAATLALAVSRLFVPSAVLAQPLPAPARDCTQARDPARCMAMPQARASCRALRGEARRQCIEDHLPPPDCRRAPDPERCQMRQQAREACKGKVGPERRQCLRQHLPPVRLKGHAARAAKT